MAIVEQVTCDVCGKLKNTVNHWWILSSNSGAITIWPWGKGLGANDSNKTHLCGQECVIQAVNRWMGEQSK